MRSPAEAHVETLRRVPLFNDLTEVELDAIALSVAVNRYQPGQTLFSEGERGGDLLIIKEGTVKVLKTAANGRQQLLAIERVGSSLGEVSVFDEGPYSTSAVAVCPVTVLRVYGAHFRALCLSNPNVAFKVIRVLGHRLRHLRRLVEDLSFATVRDRLIAHLLNLSHERGTRIADGVAITLDENNEEIAIRLGTVRELVSRNLGRLHADGLIVMRRRAVTIPDLERLRSEIQT